MSGPKTTLAADMLHGTVEIAGYIGETERRTEYLLEKDVLPAFKQGGSWRMRKSTYLTHIERLEAAKTAAF
jgi:hypothetical protein